jgi:ribokinase
MRMKKKIVILGSTNIDHIARVQRIPVPGETVGDGIYSKAFGGKGFNQAVAATRAGGNVTFLSSVGGDEDGRRIISYLQQLGADTCNVIYKNDSPTGAAFIFVDDQGENCIVVSPGANKELKVAEVEALSEVIASADYLVMQMELPYDCAEAAAEIAMRNNTFVLLNPAPACKLTSRLMSMIDLLVVNEVESDIISGRSIDKIGVAMMAESLIKMGVKAVIITLGTEGCYLLDEKNSEKYPAYKVNAIDSTGAGDTFCGALITCLADNGHITGAIKFASAAAALSVQKLGAAPSVPIKEEIEHFIGTSKF